MEYLLPAFNYIMLNGPLILSALVGLASAAIVLFSLIPGDQPEKALQGAVDFLKKFSAK